MPAMPKMAPDAPSRGRVDRPASKVWNTVAARPRPEVGNQEPDPAESMLDVVAADPEKQHVAGEMEESGVQEHRGEERRQARLRRPETPFEDEQVVPGEPPVHHGDVTPRDRSWQRLDPGADVFLDHRIGPLGSNQAERQRDEDVGGAVDQNESVGHHRRIGRIGLVTQRQHEHGVVPILPATPGPAAPGGRRMDARTPPTRSETRRIYRPIGREEAGTAT